MSLINLINQHALAAAQAGNWQSVADTLNALTTEVRTTDLRTARWLMLQLTEVVRTENGIPITEADIVLGTLQSANLPPRVKAAYDSLCNGGLDLSEQQVRDMIPILAAAANWPNGLEDKILQAGRKNVAVLETATTADACRDAFVGAAISARITNAAALAKERMLPTDTDQQLAAKWAQVWLEAV